MPSFWSYNLWTTLKFHFESLESDPPIPMSLGLILISILMHFYSLFDNFQIFALEGPTVQANFLFLTTSLLFLDF
jgi:hypothetical protein